MDKENIHEDDELLDDVEEIDEVDEEHDPMNAEKKSVDSVDKAAKTGPKAKKRPNDKEGGEKTFYKSDKGIVRELYNKLSEMNSDELRKLHDRMMDEDFDVDAFVEGIDEDEVLEDVSYDYNAELKDLVESEATLSEDFKKNTKVIFEAAIKSKIKEEVGRLEEAYEEELNEAIEETRADLVEKVDSYLNYVVENWMEENKLAVRNGLRTEIAENFMDKLRDLFEESYITVPEEKVDLVDSLSQQVEDLEEELNSSIERHMAIEEEWEELKKQQIIAEVADGLADTQIDKLANLAEDVDFDDEETFEEKVSAIKEAYFGSKKKSTSTNNSLNEEFDSSEDDDEVEVSPQMAQYVNALKKANQS